MAALNQIYRCEACGNVVQVLHAGEGELVCCGDPMVQLEEQTAEYKNEKHVPFIEKKENGFLVRVGSVLHPMEEKHYIEWIELIADGLSYRKYLNPGETPEAFFAVEAREVIAREYCNLHQLWRSE